jgi:hypothetical protein
MANLPIPQPGQPFDLSYIATIVTAINNLSAAVARSESSLSSIDNPATSTRTTLKAAEVKIIGGYKELVGDETIAAGGTKTIRYDFPDNFKLVPIVSVTASTVGTSPSPKNLSLVVTEITTGRVDIAVNFNTSVSGRFGVGVHIIAIGVPV